MPLSEIVLVSLKNPQRFTLVLNHKSQSPNSLYFTFKFRSFTVKLTTQKTKLNYRSNISKTALINQIKPQY